MKGPLEVHSGFDFPMLTIFAVRKHPNNEKVAYHKVKTIKQLKTTFYYLRQVKVTASESHCLFSQ